MKKNISIIVLSILLIACGTSSKVIKSSKKVIKGDWTLDNIVYSDYGNFKILFFNDIYKGCLEKSEWTFIPNNNTGIYNTTNEGCKDAERNFIFTIQEVDQTTGLYDFLLKPTDAKNKSIDNSGFRLRLTQLSDFNMQWEQTASIDGKSFKIYMNFLKISKQ